MIIRLEFKGTVVREVKSEAVTSEISIGRSHECTWQIPKDDGVASSRHAAIFRKGDAICLKDLGSKNGLYHKGKRITQRKFEPGDRITIGDCILSAEDRPESQAATQPSRLAVLSGPIKGQKKDLLPPSFSIGSDPTSSLVFLDMLISKKHAEITVKPDGSCWIRDCGSKNGTSVNGLPLRGEQERLLKDSDRISIAHLELVFEDGAVKHSESQVWLRFGIIVATLLVALAAYSGYQHLKPTAGAFVKDARRKAQQERFAEARAILGQAVAARNAAALELEMADMRRLLSVWESTVQTWQDAQTQLSDGQWVDASRNLGTLQAGSKEIWSWNEKAMVEKEAAAQAKRLLDAFMRAGITLDRDSLSLANLKRDRDALRAAVASVGGTKPAYLGKLLTDISAALARMDGLLKGNDRVMAALQQLAAEPPPFAAVIKEIVDVQKTAEGPLRRRAESLLEPIRGLSQSYEALLKAGDQLRDMRFAEAAAAKLNLPSVEDCAIDPAISGARKEIEDIFVIVRSTANQVSFLHGEVAKRIDVNAKVPAQLEYWKNAEALAKVFDCDVLEQALPKRSRTSSLGEYDMALGVEEFYGFVSNLPEPYDPATAQDLPFLSQLTQARTAMDRVDSFVRYADQPDLKWLVAAKLGQALAHLKELQAERDAIVRALLDIAGQSAGRRSLIAAGIAARLAPDVDKLTLKDQELKTWIVAELKRQRGNVISLNTEYDRALPSRQIEIRGEVLKLGLPGDPVVRRMWAGRDAAKVAGPK